MLNDGITSFTPPKEEEESDDDEDKQPRIVDVGE